MSERISTPSSPDRNTSSTGCSTPATSSSNNPQPDLHPVGLSDVQKHARHAPKNAQGKLYCDHVDCGEAVTFDRRCQWNKHMDKHERPYRCKELGCIKRQGFTYSGGLLRHEREMHRKQSYLEELFFCPHETCKRSSGKGFARPENLKEHMRHIHLEEPATALLTQDASVDLTQHTGSKRKRKDTGVHRGAEEGSDPTLRAKLKRLRKENKQMAQEKKRLTESIDMLGLTASIHFPTRS